jgi:hypothetical protein
MQRAWPFLLVAALSALPAPAAALTQITVRGWVTAGAIDPIGSFGFNGSSLLAPLVGNFILDTSRGNSSDMFGGREIAGTGNDSPLRGEVSIGTSRFEVGASYSALTKVNASAPELDYFSLFANSETTTAPVPIDATTQVFWTRSINFQVNRFFPGNLFGDIDLDEPATYGLRRGEQRSPFSVNFIELREQRFFSSGLLVGFDDPVRSYAPFALTSMVIRPFETVTINPGLIGSPGGFPPLPAPAPPPAVVPEPTTWAMLVIGFGVMGTALRRSRRAAALPA